MRIRTPAQRAPGLGDINATCQHHRHANGTAGPKSIIPLPARYYSDDASHWTDREGRSPQTVEEATAEQQKLVKYLRAAGDAQPNTPLGDHYHDLADIIEGCRPGRSCHSDACPMCRRAEQRWFVGAMQKLLQAVDGELATISIIPSVRIRGGDDLVHMRRQVRKAVQEIHDVVAQAGLSWAIGGIDVSRNIYQEHPAAVGKKGKFRPFWQLHLYAFAPFDEAQLAKSKLKEPLARSAATKVPLRVAPKPYDGHPAALAYGLKSDFTRRFSIPAHEGDDGQKVRRNTRDKPLTVEEKVQLAVMLHMLGPGGRLFLHGVDLENDGNGEPVLRLVQKKG